jgi:hypothetical protein
MGVPGVAGINIFRTPPRWIGDVAACCVAVIKPADVVGLDAVVGFGVDAVACVGAEVTGAEVFVVDVQAASRSKDTNIKTSALRPAFWENFDFIFPSFQINLFSLERTISYSIFGLL